MRRSIAPRGMPTRPPRVPPYSWLEPVEPADPPLNANGDLMWKCRCRGTSEYPCGQTFIAPYDHLRNGDVISCGCASAVAAKRRAGQAGPGRHATERLAWLAANGPATTAECARAWGISTHAASAWLGFKRKTTNATVGRTDDGRWQVGETQ